MITILIFDAGENLRNMVSVGHRPAHMQQGQYVDYGRVVGKPVICIVFCVL
jgi:hypothetical protein